MSDLERIIIRPGGVGDSLLLAPALSQLRKIENTPITLVGYPSRLEPLLKAGLADRILSLDNFPVHSAFDPHPGRIDSFFSTLPEHLLAETGLRIHDPMPQAGYSHHVVEYLGGCLEVPLPQKRFSPLQNLLTPLPQDQTPTIWIHPGSGGKWKRWPIQNYILAAREMARGKDGRVAFLLGEAEEDLEDEVPKAGLMIHHPSSLMDLCVLFHIGDRFLGNDSGPTHLAALMGLETLAVFGPTDPRIWGPWGERAGWVMAEGEEDWIDPGKVLEKTRHWWFDATS